MAEWVSNPCDHNRLNRLSFQAFLWLPRQLAIDLSNTLSHKPGYDNLRTILKKVRMHLLDEGDNFDANYIITFIKETKN